MQAQRVRIKMCGMTKSEDIAYAQTIGVDAIGLVFYGKSPRAISLEQARNLLHRSPLFVTVVAVLVNPTPAFVRQIIDHLPVQMLQFHGEESSEFCRQFSLPYIKAIPATETRAIHYAMTEYQDAAAILLDTPGVQGGSGIAFDWQCIPQQRSKPLVLAGGITAANVSSALSICSPDAVDVCSGIELKPGIKDHEKMTAFVQACGAHQ